MNFSFIVTIIPKIATSYYIGQNKTFCSRIFRKMFLLGDSSSQSLRKRSFWALCLRFNEVQVQIGLLIFLMPFTQFQHRNQFYEAICGVSDLWAAKATFPLKKTGILRALLNWALIITKIMSVAFFCSEASFSRKPKLNVSGVRDD